MNVIVHFTNIGTLTNVVLVEHLHFSYSFLTKNILKLVLVLVFH